MGSANFSAQYQHGGRSATVWCELQFCQPIFGGGASNLMFSKALAQGSIGPLLDSRNQPLWNARRACCISTKPNRNPRLHALLHAITQMGLVRHPAQDDQETDASQATGDQDRVAQDNARPHRENRCLGETHAERASER